MHTATMTGRFVDEEFLRRHIQFHSLTLQLRLDIRIRGVDVERQLAIAQTRSAHICMLCHHKYAAHPYTTCHIVFAKGKGISAFRRIYETPIPVP